MDLSDPVAYTVTQAKISSTDSKKKKAKIQKKKKKKQENYPNFTNQTKVNTKTIPGNGAKNLLANPQVYGLARFKYRTQGLWVLILAQVLNFEYESKIKVLCLRDCLLYQVVPRSSNKDLSKEN